MCPPAASIAAPAGIGLAGVTAAYGSPVLAGVTIRTLRLYHQIGLLPEPPRSTDGYRRYDVGHLVRLLRITRMTALGLPLSALPAVLDDQAAAEELLDELDRRAAADIERLTARRAAIAALRSSGAPPDLSPELSPWHPPQLRGHRTTWRGTSTNSCSWPGICSARTAQRGSPPCSNGWCGRTLPGAIAVSKVNCSSSATGRPHRLFVAC